jgi:hypothetical protein
LNSLRACFKRDERRLLQTVKNIRDEFIAIRESLAYVKTNWPKIVDINGARPEDFKRAERNLERTYCLRLFVEFEGILKEYLLEMHPAVIVPSKPSAEWLINKVTRLQSLPIHAELVRKVKEVRDYRNALAHSHLAYPDMPRRKLCHV